MKLIRVYGAIDSLDEFITSCCISGDFHPENAMNYMSDSLGFVPLTEENPYTSSIQKIEEIASIAGVALKETFSGNEIIVDQSEYDYIDKTRTALTSMLSERNEIAQKLEAISASAEQFTHFTDLDIPFEEIFGAKFLKIRFGFIPRDCYPKLKAYEDKKEILFFTCSKDEKNYWGLYTAPESKAEEIDRIFASLYFERIRIPDATGTPKEILENFTAEQTALTERLNELDTKISSFWSENSEHCERVYAHLKIANLAFELRRYAAKDPHSNYYAYVGWVPQSSLKWFRNQTDKIENLQIEEFEPEDDTRNAPPVKLKNRKPFRPFEMFVDMYGLPSYGGVDITPFVAVTYSVLFGMMFADMGQGLVLAIGGYILYKLKGIKLAKMIVPCGACSTVFGFLFGSVFGYEDLLDPVYHAIGLAHKPLEVMESINTILIMSIGIGIGLVVVSMLMNIYCCIKTKKYGEALFSQNGLTGIIFYGMLVCAIITFMTKKTILPGTVIAIVAVACFLILYIKELLIGKIDKHDNYLPESWSDFFMQNLFEDIEYVLSYFSNTFSYLRVGAFILVHAGMMMVFSSITSDPKSPAGIAVMVVGNIIVIALEGLLTGIQALRLEFYEMFSRFYDGGGKPFESVGMRKNRGFLFKIKKAFGSNTDEPNDNVIINVNK